MLGDRDRPQVTRRGFTLIEMAVVAAILGLILFLAATRADGLTPERSLSSGARVLAATLEEMRHAVLLRGESGTLVYDFAARACRLEMPAPLAEGASLLGLPSAPPEILLETTLPEGTVLRRILRRGKPEQVEGTLRLPVDPGGSCPPHAVQIALAEGTAVRTLRVDPVLAEVRVWDEAKDFESLFEFLTDDRP